MLLVLCRVLTVLCVLLAVAFYTLFERKILGYSQIRKGPKRVGVLGIFQPFSDAIKLFINEKIAPIVRNNFLFWLAPILGFCMSLFMWILYPSNFSLKYLNYSLIVFFCVSALSVYSILIAGWSSNSKYAFLGSVRASAQTISYEVSLLLVLLLPVLIMLKINFEEAIISFPVIIIFFTRILVWFSSSLAETNRAPFDFAEGESELVSGFNIEYGGGLFALLFLAEYANIIFISMITIVWFLSSRNFIFLCLGTVFFSLIFLLCRAAYPRHRYDLLIILCWKSFLPYRICILFLCCL